MRKTRLLFASVFAPLLPIVIFYLISLIMDGIDPIPGQEFKRVGVMLVPALLLVIPWALIGGGVGLLALTLAGKRSLSAFVAAGFLMGAVPGVVGALRSDALTVLPAVLVFGIGGVLVAGSWWAISGYRPSADR